MTEKRTIMMQLAAAALTLLLLGGVMVDKALFHTAPADADPYHARVREAAAQLPDRAGTWMATEVPVPPAAQRILHPNVIVSRRYQDLQTRRTASFLIVQCRDARDLLGHYPPVCYVGQGWNKTAAAPRDWQIDGLLVEGMEYHFLTTQLDRDAHLVVDNFMVLADGSTCRDMDGVTAAARDHRRKFFGAAQVQLVTDGSLSAAQRDELLRTLIRAHGPLIDAIRGVNQ